MSSQSQSLITVVVDGAPCGVWDTRTGGDTASSPTKRRAGGSPNQTVTRARPDTSDMTVGRQYLRDRDIDLGRRLRNRVGRATVVVTEQPLDDDDLPWGTPTTWTGLLSSINTGDVDSDSDEPRMCELGVTVTAVS